MYGSQDEFRLEFTAYQSSQPFAHFTSSFDGKSAADDISRIVSIVGNEVGDPAGQSLRFTGAWRSQYLQYRCWRGDRSLLSEIESCQQLHVAYLLRCVEVEMRKKSTRRESENSLGSRAVR